MILTVGQDFPGPVPVAEHGGGVFEVWQDTHMALTLQLPNISPAEYAAVHEGFSSYSLYVAPDPLHTLIIVWKYPAPIGYLETPFHANLYQDGRIYEYLSKPFTDNNAMSVIALDRKRIVHLRMCGLMHGFMAALHQTMHDQLKQSFSRKLYMESLDKIYRLPSKELYNRGQSWKHRMVE